eukprot:scaffold16640_cov34-Prasinocladus_malaysianus.AAC.1
MDDGPHETVESWAWAPRDSSRDVKGRLMSFVSSKVMCTKSFGVVFVSHGCCQSVSQYTHPAMGDVPHRTVKSSGHSDRQP